MESPSTPARASRQARRAACFAAGVLVLALAAPGARAATIRVTTTADSAAPAGACSLRAAILAANTDTAVGGCPAGSGADTIAVPPGTYDLTAEGADEDAGLTGDLDATSAMRIVARQGAVIDAPATGDRVLDVHAPAVVLVDGLTLQDGFAGGIVGGGGIRSSGTVTLLHAVVQLNTGYDSAGGIDNSGTLTLVHSVVQSNYGHSVGGILNTGELTLRDSQVLDNSAEAGAGIVSEGTLRLLSSTVSGNVTGGGLGPPGGGGGVFSDGPLVVRNSEITRNFAGSEGGIAASSTATIVRTTVAGNHGGGIEASGVMTISRSTIHDNDATGFGGGILNRGELRVERSAVYANTAYGNNGSDQSVPEPAFGGGIYNQGALTVTNSSVFANRAIAATCPVFCLPGSGGGIASVTPAGAAAPATLVVTASTISQNTVTAQAPSDPAPALSGGGIGLVDATAQLRGSLVAGNTAPVGPDCAGTLHAVAVEPARRPGRLRLVERPRRPDRRRSAARRADRRAAGRAAPARQSRHRRRPAHDGPLVSAHRPARRRAAAGRRRRRHRALRHRRLRADGRPELAVGTL